MASRSRLERLIRLVEEVDQQLKVSFHLLERIQGRLVWHCVVPPGLVRDSYCSDRQWSGIYPEARYSYTS